MAVDRGRTRACSQEQRSSPDDLGRQGPSVGAVLEALADGQALLGALRVTFHPAAASFPRSLVQPQVLRRLA